MTKVKGVEDAMPAELVPSVSSDVNFITNAFPKYNIGVNDVILEEKESTIVPLMREVIAKEGGMIKKLEERVSVKILASRFEKGLLRQQSSEERNREAASLERQVLLKKLRDSLEALKGRVTGKNKDDAVDALTMVEALAFQLAQRDTELIQEKSELQEKANLYEKAIDDANRQLEEIKAAVQEEFDLAKAAIQRVEQALLEQEKGDPEMHDIEELKKEVQEARRIKMLHQPSKVMDMEHELVALRNQFAENSKYTLQLKRELAMNKNPEEHRSHLYELDGSEALCSTLRVVRCVESASDVSECAFQWFRVDPEENKKRVILGATKSVYAPEPVDVGHILQVEVVSSTQQVLVKTLGPIDPAPGLGNYVETLVKKGETEFRVVIIQINGLNYSSNYIHVLQISKVKIKLFKGGSTKAKEPYSAAMELCGVRGGGNAAAQSLFWQVKKGLSFTLAFESARERNAAMMLARRFASDCNITLTGPGDRT